MFLFWLLIGKCLSRSSFLPIDTGRKLNVHKTFRRRPGRLLNVLCTFNLRPVSIGLCKYDYPKSKDEQILYLASFKISQAKFSKYLTVSSYSTYLHEHGFPAILGKLKVLQIKSEYFFSFFTDILSSANFTRRHIRNGCFFDIFYMVCN